MSVVADALASWKIRLDQIEQEIEPLLAEAEELRRGIRRLESGSGRDGGSSVPKARQPVMHLVQPQRSPKGENRRQVLAAIAKEPKTAGEIAAETGLHRGSIATLLINLVKEGVAVKAPRGYRAADARKSAEKIVRG
jgi:predicted Rossmann fold nucleotide-binding protein DprA/Smf involved in DNA uptake